MPQSHKSKVPPPQSSSSASPPSLPVEDFPPRKSRPCYSVHDSLFQNNGRSYRDGVYFHSVEVKTDPNGQKVEHLIDTWICSVLSVFAITRTNSCKEHGYLLEFIPHGERAKVREILSQSLLLGRAEDALKVLRDLGVSVLHKHKTEVRDYLDSQHLRFSAAQPADFWHSVKVVGWNSPSCFVLPTEIIGQQNKVWFNGRGEGALYGKKGDLGKWGTEVAALCEGNPYLVFAMSCSFVGPLLEPLNIPGIGIHYFGDSTTGKSSAQAVAASVWGPPSFLLSWRTTINGLEAQAASRSGTITPLDESHMIEPKHLDAGIYMLLNGVTKARMNRDTTPKEIQQWRTCVLSSGERSLESHLSAAEIDHKAGQGVRIADVPVSGKFGLFDDLHGLNSGRDFSDTLRDAAAKHYGFAGPMFVSWLIQKLPALSLQEKLTDSLKLFGNDLSAQEGRVARSFALVAVAGELAIEWGVLPWRKQSASDAALAVFKNWRAAQPKSAKSKEHGQILERIVDFIEKHGDARFSDLNWTPITNNYAEPTIRDRAGYWEDSGNKRVYLFTSGGLREATSGFDRNRVLRALDDAGAFTVKGSNGEKAKKRNPPHGKPTKFYHIDPEKLEQKP